MKNNKIQVLVIAIILTLFSASATLACEKIPEEAAQFSNELEEAGVKIDCTLTQLVNWSAKRSTDNPLKEAMRLVSAMGYEASRSIQFFSQSDIDAWRKREGGIPKAFASWKGNGAAVIYLADKKQYIPIQYREMSSNETSGFEMKITYGEDSNFSDEQKQMIQEAVSWWQEKFADKFQITLEFHLDPSIRAGGTTLVGDVPRSCFDHQPRYAEIKLKTVNTSLVSHEIGHALGIGTAAVFSKNNICSTLALAAKDIPDLHLSSARMEGNKFWGNNSKGVLMVADSNGDYGHVSGEMKDDDGNLSAVQPGLGGKPSLIDIRILEDLGYEFK